MSLVGECRPPSLYYKYVPALAGEMELRLPHKTQTEYKPSVGEGRG